MTERRAYSRAASHGRIEQARQVLVNAEEAYLRAHLWQRVLIGKEWLWQTDVAGVRLVLARVEAVKFQHHLESEKHG